MRFITFEQAGAGMPEFVVKDQLPAWKMRVSQICCPFCKAGAEALAEVASVSQRRALAGISRSIR